MNLSIMKLFEKKYNQYGDKIITDIINLQDGIYIRVNQDGTTDKMEISKKGKDISGTNFVDWVKERIIYCEILDVTNSTILPTNSGGEIRSANEFCFKIKIESINKLNNNKIDKYFKYFTPNILQQMVSNTINFYQHVTNDVYNYQNTSKQTLYYFYEEEVLNYKTSYNKYFYQNCFSKSSNTIINNCGTPYWITYNHKKPFLTNNNLFIQKTVYNIKEIELINKMLLFFKYQSKKGNREFYIPVNDFQIINDVNNINTLSWKIKVDYNGFPLNLELYSLQDLTIRLNGSSPIYFKNIFGLNNFLGSKTRNSQKYNDINVLDKAIMKNFTINDDFSVVNIFRQLENDESLLDNFDISMLNIIKQKISGQEYFQQCVSMRLSLLEYLGSTKSNVIKNIQHFLNAGTENIALETKYPELTNKDINDELYSFIYGKLLSSIGEYNYNYIFTTNINDTKNNITRLLKDNGYSINFNKSLKDMLYVIYSYTPNKIDCEYVLAGICAKYCKLNFNLQRNNGNNLCNKIGRAYKTLLTFKNVPQLTFEDFLPILNANIKTALNKIIIDNYKIYGGHLDYGKRAYLLKLINDINVNKFIVDCEQILLGIIK